MLLSEDPASLIRQTKDNFHTKPDLTSIAHINDSIETLSHSRQIICQQLSDDLHRLSRQQQSATTAYKELAASHAQSAAAHATTIANLDTQKFRTAKAIGDAELETERLAQVLADLEARLQETDIEGADGGENGSGSIGSEDEILLKLRIYRSLGMELERDEKGTGEFNRVVVRNYRKGDVQVVNMDKKVSRLAYANLFWGNI